MNIIEIGDQFYILATSSFADRYTVVLKQGDTFGIFDRYGDIHQVSAQTQGVYHKDTRYLSRTELTINNQRPLLLSSGTREDNQVLFVDLTNPDLPLESGSVVMRDTLHLLRAKFLQQNSCHERVRILNYGLETVSFTLEFLYEADFADIFEVRGAKRERRGERLPLQQNGNHLILAYRGLDGVLRKTDIRFSPQPSAYYRNIAKYNLRLQPQQEVEIEINIAFREDEAKLQLYGYWQAKEILNRRTEELRNSCAGIVTSNEQFNDWMERSHTDLITMVTETPCGLFPYAGVPWFSTIFGRDGIITALGCLWGQPDVAKGVLRYLARTQSRKFDDFRDAEPGKIIHEVRRGEMARLNEVPFRFYYGSHDATPLFIILAGAYLEFTDDIETIRLIWPNIERALYWIDHYGDWDGDGFVEYRTRSAKGLRNQGWKDSFDSVFHEDGTLAVGPIALCEIQGYVYYAKVRAAQIARALGYAETAVRLTQEAEKLKENFNARFWSEEKKTYVLALDGDKRPCNVMTSNAGHCLFSGIATHERARHIAANFLSEAMFSGWGIRTLAANEVRYNPMSYHNGSIWPHDNALIAYGFSRYGLKTEAVEIMTALFEAAIHCEGQRLPELFCGFQRRPGQPPTLYPVACSPQSWAVGSIFILLHSLLGLHVQASRNTISFCQPVLPPFINEVTITNLQIKGKRVAVQVRKGKDGVQAVLLSGDRDVVVNVREHTFLEPVP